MKRRNFISGLSYHLRRLLQLKDELINADPLYDKNRVMKANDRIFLMRLSLL